MTLEHL